MASISTSCTSNGDTLPSAAIPPGYAGETLSRSARRCASKLAATSAASSPCRWRMEEINT
jgi:hypothetical protein